MRPAINRNWLSGSLNISEKATVLSARVPNNIRQVGKCLSAHAALWQVEVEDALAFCTSCLGKRGTFVQSAQIPGTEVDNVSSQTAKVFGGEFKGFHAVLNLITGRLNSHKRNLKFPGHVGLPLF